MRATLLFAVFCIVQSSVALDDKRCSTLAPKINFNTYHAKHLNSTYHAAETVQVPNGASNISNDIPFCEVYASVNYAKGANLVFALWLPDKSDYEQRFLAVGNGAYGGVIDSTKMMDSPKQMAPPSATLGSRSLSSEGNRRQKRLYATPSAFSRRLRKR
jgi:hypothetical protein